jgi:His/Glu/Gln/Arg/opine family amino acid ABC transporter permease subunit
MAHLDLAAFLPKLFDGFLINLHVALASVLIGLALGLPLAALRDRARVLELPIRWAIRLMQAAPVYVIMFFILNMLPHGITLFGERIVVTALSALILAQALNMVAYMEENGLEALRHARARRWPQAILFLPNILRGFIVVVMSSGIGAAIGVSEAVGVTLHHARGLPALGDRVALFLIVITCFVAVFGTANALLRRVITRIGARGNQ